MWIITYGNLGNFPISSLVKTVKRRQKSLHVFYYQPTQVSPSSSSQSHINFMVIRLKIKSAHKLFTALLHTCWTDYCSHMSHYTILLTLTIKCYNIKSSQNINLRNLILFRFSAVVHQNNRSHTQTTLQNTCITNTHTHMCAHARLQQLRSELLSLVSQCMCDMIWQVLAAGPGLLTRPLPRRPGWLRRASCPNRHRNRLTLPTKAHVHSRV